MYKKIINKLSKISWIIKKDSFFQKSAIKLVKKILRLTDSDLLYFTHLEIGIGNYGSVENTGEKWMVENILKKYFDFKEKYTFFDIGANTGEYSYLLRSNFKNANIYSFEPNPRAFSMLKKENVIAENMGLGEKIHHNKILYSFKDMASTQLGTTNREILDIYTYQSGKEIEKISFFSDTVDNYCSTHNIKEVDFIKIDVEGDELFVLQGSKQLLKDNKIKIIQFEFNETDSFNRIFLKDFYNILENFDLFRIKKGSLIPLGKYNKQNEIFCYQNILAIKKNLKTIK